jgi:hypothetical protein
MIKQESIINIKLPWGPKKALLISDVHWDNPKCKRNILRKHLDKALEDDALIFLNGDTFCLMQGKADPRKSKADIRPEHNVYNYFDAVIEDAVEWFKPYAKNIVFVGYGNHETSIIKHQEIDVIQRFCYGLNTVGSGNVKVGGYGGWVILSFIDDTGHCVSYKIKYHHGYGGGGPVTKGTIQHNRFSTFVEGADMLWFGHVHEDYEVTYSIEYLSTTGVHKVKQRNVTMLRTSTYKDEFDDGTKGFHIERGRGPKFIGGRWLELEPITLYLPERKKQIILNSRTYKTF